jgi:hypothetical protein
MVLRLEGVINLNLDKKNMFQVIFLKNMLQIISYSLLYVYSIKILYE